MDTDPTTARQSSVVVAEQDCDKRRLLHATHNTLAAWLPCAQQMM